MAPGTGRRGSGAWLLSIVGLAFVTGIVVAYAQHGSADRIGPGRGMSHRQADVVTTGNVVPSAAQYALASDTVADWVANVDHVVIVRAIREREVVSEEPNLAPGESDLSFRRVTVKVEKVLWSSPYAVPGEVPGALDWFKLGRLLDVGKGGQPQLGPSRDANVSGVARVVPGHTYIAGLIWDIGTCATSGPDAEHTAALKREPGWASFAQFGVVPYDDAVLGRGELGGQIVDLEQMFANGGDGPQIMRETAGKSAGAFVTMLDHAQADPRIVAAKLKRPTHC